MLSECPHCGETLREQDVLEVDGWYLEPSLTLYRGKRILLTVSEASILHTLASAKGVGVEPETIGKQFSATDDCKNTVRVLVARIRRKLGRNCPIETIHGYGYRWNSRFPSNAREYS